MRADVAEAPIVTSGQLVIPTRHQRAVRGTSRDVIHSFWIPRLNGKRDMVPGRVQTLRACRPTSPASTPASAPSSAGSRHANMRMEAVALDPRRLPDVGRQPARAVHASPEEGTPAAEGEAHFMPAVRTLSPGQRPRRRQGQRRSRVTLASAPDEYVYAGAAPNLTNLMTRNTFAGRDVGPADRGVPRRRVERARRQSSATQYLAGRHRRNASTRSTCASGSVTRPRRSRCTPIPRSSNRQTASTVVCRISRLSEDQIDLVVAYLIERK